MDTSADLRAVGAAVVMPDLETQAPMTVAAQLDWMLAEHSALDKLPEVHRLWCVRAEPLTAPA